MGPARHNLSIIRGDDFSASFRFTTENPSTGTRTPINLSGWSAASHITNMTDGAEFEITAVISDPSNGVVSLSIADTDTALFPKRNADWYLTLISPSTDRTTYMAGDVFFIKPGGPV